MQYFRSFTFFLVIVICMTLSMEALAKKPVNTDPGDDTQTTLTNKAAMDLAKIYLPDFQAVDPEITLQHLKAYILSLNTVDLNLIDAAMQEYLISLQPVSENNPPTISGAPAASVTEGDNYLFAPSASDPDGDALNFTIANKPAWAGFDSATGTLSGTPASGSAGLYTGITISVSDGELSANLAPFSIEVVQPEPVNQPPVISGVPATSVTEGDSYTFAPSATDPDGDALNFSIANKPAWAGFDSATGILSGTPTAEHIGNYENIRISVSDGIASALLSPFAIAVKQILISEQSLEVRIASGMDDVEENNYGSMYVNSSDLELTYDGGEQRVGLRFPLDVPPGATINQSSLQFTVDEVSTGSTNLTILAEASDNALAFTTDSGNLSSRPLTVASATWAPADWTTVGANGVDQTTPDLSNLIQELVSRPGWKQGNHLVLIITGSGTRTADSYDGSATTAPLLKVSYHIAGDQTDDSSSSDDGTSGEDDTATGTNAPPTISGTPASHINEGDTYSFSPTASDADADVLNFTITNKPAWASFNAATGKLSGIPTYDQAGLYSDIQISVSDGTDTASLAAFSITVKDVNRAPTISGSPASTVTAGVSYTFTPTASDADGDSLIFSVSNLPSWASFDVATGLLSGVPQSTDLGSYDNILISVSDGVDSSQLAAFSVLVEAEAVLTSTHLSWAAPATREDGSALPLSEIEGYRIYMGDTEGSLVAVMDINDYSVNEYTLTGIQQGDHYFAVTAYDTTGNESGLSNVIFKTCY